MCMSIDLHEAQQLSHRYLPLGVVPTSPLISNEPKAGSPIYTAVQVRARQLWGVNVYTNDSDLVAVLMHCGYLNNAFSIPPGAASEMRAIVQILPPQPSYPSCARNGIRSRAWGATADALSYKVRCQARPKPWAIMQTGTVLCCYYREMLYREARRSLANGTHSRDTYNLRNTADWHATPHVSIYGK